MSYTIEKLANEPIILHVIPADHSFAAHGQQSIADIFNMLDAQNVPTFVIFDMAEANFSLEDVMQAASVALKQVKLLSHPKLREAVLVSNSRLIKLAADGLKSNMFGNVNIRSFDTRSAALTYTRSQAAKQSR